MNISRKKTVFIVVLLLQALSLGFLLSYYSPNSSPLIVISAIVLLAGGIAGSGVYGGLSFFHVHDKLAKLLSVVIGCMTTLLMMFQAIGDVTAFDMVLIVVLASTLVFYLYKTWSS